MDLSKILDTIETYIRPYSFPVAVKIATSEMEMPKFLSPIKALGHRIAVCQAIGLSRHGVEYPLYSGRSCLSGIIYDIWLYGNSRYGQRGALSLSGLFGHSRTWSDTKTHARI